jgi:predicted RNA-binding protein YlxR (DUF448 family)
VKVRIEPVNDRMCIVTRERGQPDGLLRFVAGPSGQLIPDLRLNLPGRGCWVTAEREKVELAVKRKLFGRALKTEVTVDPDLGATVEGLLCASLLGMMNMARKSGQFITGSGKVEEAVRSGAAIALMHASDAAEDGIRKLRQANTARAKGDRQARDSCLQAVFSRGIIACHGRRRVYPCRCACRAGRRRCSEARNDTCALQIWA